MGPDASCCPYAAAIDLLSRRHALTIIWLLQQESPRRFTAIKNELAVNPVTLSQRLQDLEEAGIISRTTYNETPPRVEYALTAMGADLVPVMQHLGSWATKWEICGPTKTPLAAPPGNR